MSCILVRHGSAVRGEIIYFDVDGYSEVFSSRRRIFEIFFLQHPNALCVGIPALCIECHLHRLDQINESDAESLVEEACAGDGLLTTVITRCRANRPYLIKLFDRERRDVAILVAQGFDIDNDNALDNDYLDE